MYNNFRAVKIVPYPIIPALLLSCRTFRTMAGLYIHIPFCKRKCGYCDFYSCTRLEMRPAALAALLGEMEAERDFLPARPLDTIYIGGGTPTLYTPRELQSLITRAQELWGYRHGAEITVEANPDDLTPQYLEALAATDVNRLSIGIQSFLDRDLRLMNRRHTAAQAIGAVKDAQRAGFSNISIDLIYGIPGMDGDEWRGNIDAALGLDVHHISAYHLTIEDGTPMGRAQARGEFTPVEENRSEEQYLLLHTMLAGAGYEHYEISNFARPGLRARHNSSYWSGEPYLGIGPAAHSFDGVRRRGFPRSLELYLTDRAGNYITETLTPDDRFNEYVMTRLRTAEGVDTGRMEALFGTAALRSFEDSARKHVRTGLLVRQGARIFIPAEKFLVSDVVIADLFIG